MSRIMIECRGGLGNRLGSLVSGLQVAKQCNLTPMINWTRHNTCDCPFEDLFQTNIDVFSILNHDLDLYTTVSHQGATDIKHNKRTISNILESNKPIFYFNDEIPKYLDPTITTKNLLQFKPKRQILDNVKNFVSTNQIDNNTQGLHIRKTDLDLVNEDSWIPIVEKNPKQKFFVCSDSKHAEEKFSKYSNVVTKSKSSYVEKFIDDKWKTSFFDADGNKARYNVNRSRDSVIQALEDLLILSHTDIQRTSRHSSFLRFAFFYKNLLKEIMA
tara:strand:- start:356 stop:1171 length:816 start_codon:yes stop_codon:yes gene_type:complete